MLHDLHEDDGSGVRDRLHVVLEDVVVERIAQHGVLVACHRVRIHVARSYRVAPGQRRERRHHRHERRREQRLVHHASVLHELVHVAAVLLRHGQRYDAERLLLVARQDMRHNAVEVRLVELHLERELARPLQVQQRDEVLGHAGCHRDAHEALRRRHVGQLVLGERSLRLVVQLHDGVDAAAELLAGRRERYQVVLVGHERDAEVFLQLVQGPAQPLRRHEVVGGRLGDR